MITKAEHSFILETFMLSCLHSVAELEVDEKRVYYFSLICQHIFNCIVFCCLSWECRTGSIDREQLCNKRLIHKAPQNLTSTLQASKKLKQPYDLIPEMFLFSVVLKCSKRDWTCLQFLPSVCQISISCTGSDGREEGRKCSFYG